MTDNFVIRYESEGQPATWWLGSVTREMAENQCKVLRGYKHVKNVRLENLSTKSEFGK